MKTDLKQILLGENIAREIEAKKKTRKPCSCTKEGKCCRFSTEDKLEGFSTTGFTDKVGLPVAVTS